MAEVITYETLREIQRNEKKGEKLVDLTEEFYTDVKEYLNRDIQDDISATEIRNANAILSDIQDRRERKILSLALRTVRSKEAPDTSEMTTLEKELFEGFIKMLKSHRENIENSEIVKEPAEETVEEAPAEEETGANETEESSEEPKEEKPEETEEAKEEKTEEKPEKPEEIQVETEPATETQEPGGESGQDEKTYIKLRILEEVPEIIGADLKSYGPFKGGDLVELPPENAKIFIESGKATEDVREN